MPNHWSAQIARLRSNLIEQQISIAPLIVFRIIFGAMMFIGAIRFIGSGWIEKLFLTPTLFFKFYGFHWVQYPGDFGIYFLHWLSAIAALFIALGFLYRFATICFFLSFTYIELLDATNYLNHYYLVCLLGFLLIFLPANASFSLDQKLGLVKNRNTVSAWCIHILIFQITIVYTYAGLAKLNSDWLFHAMPLSIWLPEHQDLPIIGAILKYKWAAYLFSWGGAIYDLSIAYLLMWKRTRLMAYFMVLIFHTLVGILFNIGMFPIIMISSTLIFFSAEFHEKLLNYLGWKPTASKSPSHRKKEQPPRLKIITWLLGIYMLVQILLPLRFLFYPGHLLWTEEGYRFSWRVMLVEKIGQCTFFIQDSQSERRQEIVNGSYLTQFQEKQMSIQPDFILQFAHFLKTEYESKHGFVDPIITVDAHAALNGRISQRLIDPDINLALIEDDLRPKKMDLTV